MDWFVLVTPLLVFGVLLLLGFAGCDRVFGTDYVEPQPPPHTLTLQVRVPAQFTILLARFVWTRPGSTVIERTTALDRTDETDTFLLTYVVQNVEGGDWTVSCRLRVEDAAAQQEDVTPHTFMLMADSDETILFTTMGAPSTGDFEVVPPTIP